MACSYLPAQQATMATPKGRMELRSHVWVINPHCQFSLFSSFFKLIKWMVAYWMQPSYLTHYNDVIMGAMASQITSLIIVYLTVYSGADQRKHQSSASLAFVWGIHRWPVNSPHKWPVTRKMFQFDDVIMSCRHSLGDVLFVIGIKIICICLGVFFLSWLKVGDFNSNVIKRILIIFSQWMFSFHWYISNTFARTSIYFE